MGEEGGISGISPCSWWGVVPVFFFFPGTVMGLGLLLSRGKGLEMLPGSQWEGAAGKFSLNPTAQGIPLSYPGLVSGAAHAWRKAGMCRI